MALNHKKIVTSLALFTVLNTAITANTTEDLAQSIIKLRGDVENLYTDIKEKKERYSAQMKSLSMQITDSQAQINRQETAIKLAKSELEKIKTKIAQTTSANTEIRPLTLNAIELLKKSIKEGLPFKTEERIAALEKIKKDLEDDVITNEKALALTWASYDDTIRLTKEIGLFKQNIELNGKKVLAKVAKLGSVALFFSTPNEELGYVIKTENGYKYKIVTDPEDKKRILSLFDALQKQIRTGFFELPNALVLQGAQ